MKREGMDDGEVVEVEVRWNLPVTRESEHLKVDRLIDNNIICGSSGIQVKVTGSTMPGLVLIDRRAWRFHCEADSEAALLP
jgi:hypothetical protein